MKLIQRIKCFFNRHSQLLEVERLSDSSQKLYCPSCKKHFAINHDVKVFLPWDSSFESFYRDLKEFNRKYIELDDLFKKSRDETFKRACEVSEEIVIAFCAKYKIPPDQAVGCYQGNLFWVEKRDEDHIKKISAGKIRSADVLFKRYKKLLKFAEENNAYELLKEIGDINE